MVNKAPKPFRYTIQYGENELVLTTDPKGWQEHSIGFTRSDDFGLNVETVIALSFSKEGRNLLRSLYEQTGIFTKAFLLIEKRNNDWVYNSFYKYRLDFSTYTDSMNFIDISGIEEGLLSAFSAYKDTEYEITLPIFDFINYTGISVERRNLIQANFGEMYEKSGIGDSIYPLGGSRSVRTYSDSLAFVDFNGEPYETMTIRCIKDITFDLHVKLNNKIVAKRFLSAQGTGGDIKLIKHDSEFGTSQPPINLTYTKETTVDSGIFYHTNTTTFVGDEVIENISLTAGQCISLCYIAESGTYSNVSNSEAQDTFIEVSTLSESSYKNANLTVFSFETLLNALLDKISPDATLDYKIVNDDYDVWLTTTNHVKVIGAISGEVTFKAKLSDALKAIHCLNNVGIDISGNILTIDYLENFYKDVYGGEIICKNIVLKHDQKHQYNKISVGYKVDERGDNEDLTYPYNCQKEFEVKNAISESAISLVNPYIADPYEIEQLIINTAGEIQNEIDTKFMVFCYDKTAPYDFIIATSDAESLDDGHTYRLTTLGGYPTMDRFLVNVDVEGSSIENLLQYNTSLFYYVPSKTGKHNVQLNIVLVGTDIENRVALNRVNTFTETHVIETEEVIYDTNRIEYRFSAVFDLVEMVDALHFEIDLVCSENITSVTCTDLYYNVFIDKGFYKSGEITNFVGDSATAYNLPITPKRIMQKHLNYLSVSNLGNVDDIAFVTSEIDSNITSMIGSETVPVVENANVESITPIFLPVTIECDTVTDFSSTFADNKYKYLKIIDQKSGKMYQGWINSITFAPTKKKSTKLILQAKSI